MNWGRELKHVPPAARVSLSTVQSNVAQLSQGFKLIEREIPLNEEDSSDPFRSIMSEFFERKKEECFQLEADTKTMEVTNPDTRPFEQQSLHIFGCIRRRTSSSWQTLLVRVHSARLINSSLS